MDAPDSSRFAGRDEDGRPTVGDSAFADADAVDADDGSLLALAERLALASLGAVVLTGQRADELVDALVERGGAGRDEARRAVRQLAGRWRADAGGVGGRAGALGGILRELGVVTRAEYEELDLRVAQVEHRLRLLEREPRTPPPTA